METQIDVDIFKDAEMVPVNEIFPSPNNPKAHPEKQLDKLEYSIRKFGWDVPITANEDGEIIKGAGRYYVATERLGMEEVPVIWRENLTEAELKAMRIADNRVAESEWLYGELEQEMEAIEIGGIDLEATGFDPSEIDVIMEDMDVMSNDLGSTSSMGREPTQNILIHIYDYAVKLDAGDTYDMVVNSLEELREAEEEIQEGFKDAIRDAVKGVFDEFFPL